MSRRTGKYYNPKKIVKKEDGFMEYVGSETESDE